MIDLYNMEYREAGLAIESLGLRIGTPTYEHNDVVPYNHVISFTPLKDTVLKPGDKVDMVLSLGPEALKLDMPTLVGLTQEQAESKILMRHLEIGDISEEYNTSVPKGTVLDQYPEAGTQVSEGIKVNLHISLGPDPSTLPVPEPDPEPEENPDGSKTVAIPLPANDGMIHLRVEMDGEDVFNGEVDAAMNTSQMLTIFGSGTKKLYIYYDGALSRTMDVEF